MCYHFTYVQIEGYKLVPADIQGLQQADGSFTGDESGEIDTRCAFHQASTILTLRLLVFLVKSLACDMAIIHSWQVIAMT